MIAASGTSLKVFAIFQRIASDCTTVTLEDWETCSEKKAAELVITYVQEKNR
jgi:hypothetical protein